MARLAVAVGALGGSALCVLVAVAVAQGLAATHLVPFFPTASDARPMGLVRVVNLSDESGTVDIVATDAAGQRFDDVSLAIGAHETVHFDADDLEMGNADVGLTGGTGAGRGDWRLELTGELDIEVQAYVRMLGSQGYVTPMHDTSAQETDGLMRYYVPIFHGADYEGQESRLHLLNLGESEARVGIAGLDDAGAAPPAGDVSLVLGPGETRVVTSGQLEDGGQGLDGRFGSGEGRWRLFVSSQEALQVMSLGYSADGFLANLSRGSPPASVAPVVAPVVAPDLVVEIPSVSDGAPEAGQAFTLSARVRNRGDGDAGATTLRYYRSANANISASDLEVGNDRVNALSASQSSGASLTLNAPQNPGTYYYGACADAVPDESDTTNNCSAGLPITVSEPGASSAPDLVVSVSVDNDTPDAGGEFELTATVRNVGDGASSSTTLRYYRSRGAIVSASDIEVDRDPVDMLDASGMSIGSIVRKVPTTAKTDYYGACVDAVRDESDKTNNCSAAIAVTPQSLGAPDLVVEVTAGSDISELTAGQSLTLDARVTNVGDGPSALTTLRYYRSADRTITTSDTEEATDPVGVLPTKGSRTNSGELTAPSEQGTHYFGACVDEVPGESDTTNNCSSAVEATVKPPRPPDLYVWAISSYCRIHWYGEDAELRGLATNSIGETRSPPSKHRFYLHIEDPSAKWLVATREVPSLAPTGHAAHGGGHQHSIVEVPVPKTLGGYTQTQCLDVVDGETNTANSCASKFAFEVVEATHMDDLNLTVPEGCSLEAKFCLNTGFYGHWGPGAGGLVRFKLNGGAILSTRNKDDRVCATAPVNVGSNSMQVDVVSTTEDRLCPPSGSLDVQVSNAVSTSWNIPTGHSTTSTLNVSLGNAETCPGAD